MNRRQHGPAGGFSLIEVLVALIIISVGLLGVARMQALSISNTNAARSRSLAAIEAASLASAMHSNRAYWAANYPTITVAGTTVTSSDGALNAAVNCNASGGSAPCNATQLAASDLNEWVVNYAAIFPAGTATITCSALTTPLSCTILLAWTENVINSAQQTGASAAALQTQTYNLYVQP
jgi:type IV pilus assembly protein PilV